ncbi:MAG: DUF4351 domain-containing protein [bacterium]
MEDTPVGQELIQMGEKKGIEEGIPKGIRQVLLKQIAARFGTVPKEIHDKLQTIDSPDSLERIATMLLTIQSIDELEDLVN